MNCSTIVYNCTARSVQLCNEAKCIPWSNSHIISIVLIVLGIIQSINAWKCLFCSSSYKESICQKCNECIWSVVWVLVNVFIFISLIFILILIVIKNQYDNQKAYSDRISTYLAIVCIKWILAIPLMIVVKKTKITPDNNHIELTEKQQKDILDKHIQFRTV